MWQEQQGGTQAPLSCSLMFLSHFDVFFCYCTDPRYQEKMLLMVTSSIRLSPNRSQVRTDQNTRTIQSCLLWIFQLKIQAPQNLSSCVVILCLSVLLVGCKKFYLWTTSLDCKYLIPSATSLWNRMFLQFNSDAKKLSKKSFLLKLKSPFNTLTQNSPN